MHVVMFYDQLGFVFEEAASFLEMSELIRVHRRRKVMAMTPGFLLTVNEQSVAGSIYSLSLTVSNWNMSRRSINVEKLFSFLN